MNNPVESVLGTAELLEHILHRLPIRDLLLAQRVCRDWKTVIEDSPKLQRALFFTPMDVELLKLKYTGNDSIRIPHWITSDGHRHKVFKNPLLDEAWKALGITNFRLPVERLPRTWLDQNASWRRMLITQPAVALSRRESFSEYSEQGSITFQDIDTSEQRVGRLFGGYDRWYQLTSHLVKVSVDLLDHTWEKIESGEQLE